MVGLSGYASRTDKFTKKTAGGFQIPIRRIYRLDDESMNNDQSTCMQIAQQLDSARSMQTQHIIKQQKHIGNTRR